jgi:adenine deaminase
VAHDSHNLVVAGMSDSDMLVAARYICSIGGGLAVAYNGQIIANLPLPIAGLMSDKPIELVIANLKTVNEACNQGSFYVTLFSYFVCNTIFKADRQRVIRYRKISAYKLVGTILAAIANVVPFLYP